MKKFYPVIASFLLSIIIVFLAANTMVNRYEKKARRELERNIYMLVESIQNRMQTFIGVEDDSDILSSVMKEIMDENDELVCVKVVDSPGNVYFQMGKDNACKKYLSHYRLKSRMDKELVAIQMGVRDVYIYHTSLQGVLGGTFDIYYVIKTQIFRPLYSLKFYFNLLAGLFLFMEFLFFMLIVAAERKLAKYRENLISFEQAVILDRLAGFLAHELKNPLFVLSGNIELAAIPDDEKMLLLSEIQRIKGIIERYEGVLRKTHKGISNPEEVLFNIERLFKTQFEKRGLYIKVNCSDSFDVKIPENQFKQIAINLVLNALQINSSIDIECMMKSGSVLSISFCTDGEEIPERIRKRMFEPYFTTRREGTGLGLFISRTIAEGYGGKLYYVHRDNKNCFVLEVKTHENTGS